MITHISKRTKNIFINFASVLILTEDIGWVGGDRFKRIILAQDGIHRLCHRFKNVCALGKHGHLHAHRCRLFSVWFPAFQVHDWTTLGVVKV